VATISRLLKIIGLFCKRALYKWLYSAKEACNFKEPTIRSWPISGKGQYARPTNVSYICIIKICHMNPCNTLFDVAHIHHYNVIHMCDTNVWYICVVHMRHMILHLQNIVSFIGLFCKRDLCFKEPTNRSHPICMSCPLPPHPSPPKLTRGYMCIHI